MTRKKQSFCLYESVSFRQMTGATIRPGGFKLTERALAFAGFVPGSKVLDVGCGQGATVAYLIDHYKLAAVGVDPSLTLLEQGLSIHPGLPLLEGAGENLPFGNDQMDGIFAECTLSVMEDQERALREFWRVLKPGGLLVMTDLYLREPLFAGELRTLEPKSCLGGALTAGDLADKLKYTGFDILIWEDHSRLLAELTGRLILSGAGLDDLPGQAFRDNWAMIKKSRPGYLLLIAGKP